MQNTAEQN